MNISYFSLPRNKNYNDDITGNELPLRNYTYDQTIMYRNDTKTENTSTADWERDSDQCRLFFIRKMAHGIIRLISFRRIRLKIEKNVFKCFKEAQWILRAAGWLPRRTALPSDIIINVL